MVTCPIQNNGLNLRSSQWWSLSRRTCTRADWQWWAGGRPPGRWAGDKVWVSLLPGHCFLLQKKGWQPTACPRNRAHGQPWSACKGCSSHCFLKSVQSKKNFFFALVVWASARSTCFRVLLNTWFSWCPSPELQMFMDRKGHEIPVAPMNMYAQNPKGSSRCTPGASRSPSGRKNMNWPLPSKMYEPPEQDTAKYVRCPQHSQGCWTSVQHPPSAAARGSELQRLVTYPVKITSFNQWCVYS